MTLIINFDCGMVINSLSNIINVNIITEDCNS